MSAPPPVTELLEELRSLLRSPEAEGEAARRAALAAGSGRIVLRLVRHTERPGVRLLDVVTELDDDGGSSGTVLAMGTPVELLALLDGPRTAGEVRRCVREGELALLRLRDLC
ncbi:hypothetical protein [Actinocorallia libanotica]|uniref:SCP-2 sterol transfer family protein n=1 Tax=Actinocorallia libanotica TaxID=46162 RepID=A0ABP4BYI5_9ACTN